jgi:formate hydrogenlyase transcriptional activator
MGKEIGAIEKESLNSLLDYDYPGNVRELENLIERAVILSPDGVLRVEFLEPANESKTPDSVNTRTLEDFERRFILQTLSETGWLVGGVNGAAKRLGLKRTTLISKMEKLGIARGL